MASRHIFRGRTQYHPASSALGQLCKRVVQDERQAEAWYLIAACSLVTVSAIVAMAAASLTEPQGAGINPLWFWPWVGFGLILVVSLLGFASGVQVSVGTDELSIKKGRQSRIVRLAEITRSQIIDAHAYYRQYARYTDTKRFMARIPDDVLVLTVGQEHIAIGLDPPSHAALGALIEKEILHRIRLDLSHTIEHGV